MPRLKRLVIPLNESEKKSIARWAERERLPPATAARRILLNQAEKTAIRSSGGDGGGDE
jgi:hypothetical protein